jgi:hypothetical protein
MVWRRRWLKVQRQVYRFSGAILLTGYLGGAVATHVRVAEGVFSIVFAVVFGILIWLGLYLRDPLLQTLIPLRTSVAS